ncbi:MAG: sulfatase-like hydrolase/transferase [Pirellulales bacterium]|nr:sulfatase-like hydrolase/transferase [Pirellulales bacterium]
MKFRRLSRCFCFRSLLPLALVATLVGPSAVRGQQTAPAQRPNILVIIADDLGYGETGMMGNSEIPTPAIDALATDGVRCTAGYVTASYCSPSRAGILTGRYQSRFGYDVNPTGKRNLLPQAGLPETETTFVQRLAKAGYATGLMGKWHLGAAETKHPLRRGFEDFYGFLHEGHFYVPGPPYQGVLTMIRDTSLPAGQRRREGDLIRGNYTPISEPAYDDDNPVLRGTEEIVEPDYLTDAITDQAVRFIGEHAGDPFLLMVAYGAVHSPMQARHEDLEELRWIKDDQRRIFAGMLVALDRGVARLREAIADNGLSRRTLIVFVSDNGGPTAELTSSNAPLRGGKGTLYEGGIRVPMIWTMPGRLPAGRMEARPVLSLDIAATALDLAGLSPAEEMDGKSLLSWINHPSREHAHQDLFWRMPGGKLAFRSGNWKIVRPRKNDPIELYHLASDASEKRNLVNDHPEKLGELINKWLAMNARMADPIELPRVK